MPWSAVRSVAAVGAIAAVVGTSATVPATADDSTWSVTGPGSDLTAVVSLSDGAPSLEVTRGGRTVLPASGIGVLTEDTDLTDDLTFTGRSDRTVVERYRTTTGKERKRHTVMRETTLSFTAEDGTPLDLVVRVAPDGVAYRYHLPSPDGTAIVREASSWTLPTDAPAWMLDYSSWYEEPRFEATAGSVPSGDFGYPALFSTAGSYVLLTESGLSSDYPGSMLTHEQGSGRYQVGLVERPPASSGPLSTPWRVAVVGDLDTVTESTLVDDLAPDSRVADTSWIEPGTVAWSWLPEHDSPRDPERQRDYIDYAAEHGWSYVLIDEGWDASWVPEVTRYARAKGVDVLLWFRWWEVDTAEEMDHWFGLLNDWGVKGVKIDFMNTGEGHGEGVSRHDWYERVLAATAEHRLLVNFHGSTLPKGMQRTWPHLMTYEAVRGAEYYSFSGDHQVTPEHNTTLPFTRNVVGSMDYTPVTLSQDSRFTSDGHEIALPVVFESGLLHLADRPEVFPRYPDAERFLDQVPAVWDETELLSGEPGSEVVLARRQGDRWFVGGIAAGDARTLSASLDFLGRGDWRVDLFRDGEDGTGVVRESHVLDRHDELTVPVADNGGFAAIVCRADRHRDSCERPVPTVPDTTLDLSAESATVPAGGSVRISAQFTLDEGERVHDVSLRPSVPEDWHVEGEVVRARSLRAGETLSGTWTLVAPQDGPRGRVDLPLVAQYRLPGGSGHGEPVHVERAVDVLVPPDVPRGEVFVSDLPFLSSGNGWGPVERDASVGEQEEGDGAELTIGGTTYAKGLGVHAPSSVELYLGGACTRLTAEVGVDDEVGDQGSVSFEVRGDDEQLAVTPTLRGADGAHLLDVPVDGVRLLTLSVHDGGDGVNHDHADWGGARLVCTA
ncbi:glycoside hydrolase family 97 catalytic domain-containing protein [Saccharomonospora cyanea]|uniref:Putative carbohydrate binding protein,alpha-galactosidase family protein n=1 Tax=Saccharomonospora cyanea NA-134 TaxID=882082 RepID=H5XQX7_9PSEU|nr:glycoside hydrolase family 97 catalytic domain-containing protein [Saccharomonospora cyanea]EHR61217.1 putative carbohydrate binding protein,alpha-galactosidase family protein [Saccharomonospora cyanea NA-134]